MAVFVATLDLTAPGDRSTVLPMGDGAGPEDVREHDRSGPFQVYRAHASVGRKASYATRGDIAAVIMVRWDDRADLLRRLELPAASADAEMLLSAYAKWGTDLLHHVGGEFAFAVWDAGQQIFFAATDPLGSRPLFHAIGNDRLLVSDSLEELRDSGAVSRELNEATVGDFLCLGLPCDQDATLFRDIQRLPPGHMLLRGADTIRVERYWQMPREPLLLLSSMEEYAEQFRELFFRAVEDRIPESGRIGILLSGGMDSTSVAAALKHVLGPGEAAERVVAYTAVSRLAHDEEGKYSSIAAQHLGLRHVEMVFDELGFEGAPAAKRLSAHPAVNAGIAGLRPATEIAEDGGVMFSGQGGDVLLQPQQRDLPRLLQGRSWTAPFALARYASLFRAAPASGARRAVAHRLRRGGAVRLPLWVREDFARRIGLSERIRSYHDQLARGPRAFIQPFWTNMLTMGASSTTGMSLEPAQPFLDTRLLRFALRLPDPVLANKWVLRHSMRDYLPTQTLLRPKTSFGEVSVLLQLDPTLATRQAQWAQDASSAVDSYIDRSVLLRCLCFSHVDTTAALNRTEMILRWLDATVR